MAMVIEAEGLTNRFRGARAPAGVDIAAGSGQVLALLGGEL
jgi:ABC-type multidrug transport system ATPase subunit